MEISIETWKRYSYEVIDYESDDLLNSFFEINTPGFIYRNKDEILNTKYKLQNNIEKLFEILLNENLNYELKFNHFEFDEDGIVKTNNSAWFALIKSKMDDEIDLNRYELKDGDIIRMGRIYLRIKTIKIQKYEKNNNLNISTNSINSNNINNNVTNSNNININSNLNFNGNISLNTEINLQEVQVNSPVYRKKSKFNCLNLKANSHIKIEEEKKEHFCRICYGEEDENDNPLVQPCSCHGSMKYIHLNCLKQWLNINTYILHENNEFCKTFKIKEARCELCKTKLPDFIRHKGKLYEINDFGIDYKNYIIIESLTVERNNNNNNKFLHIISLDNNNQLISIGRGKDCLLNLNDASISRNHCAIRYNNKKLFLEDCCSKFGTLILCHIEKINLIDELRLYLQIGRSFIKCNVKKTYSLFSCCNISEAKNFDFYYKQNKIKTEDINKMTVKTEIDYDLENNDNNNNDNEDEKNEKLINEFDNENNINEIKNNKKKIMGVNEDNLFTDIDIYVPTVNLKSISECIDENNNEINNSDNNQNKGDLSEERKEN